jgi:hypothetical protein
MMFGVLFTALATGCVVRGSAHVSAPIAVIEVEEEPPPPRVIVVAPRPGFIWIEGRWVRGGGRWVWRDGYYERVRAGHVWRQGRWERRGRRHVWVEGRWARQDARDRRRDRGPQVRDHRR